MKNYAQLVGLRNETISATAAAGARAIVDQVLQRGRGFITGFYIVSDAPLLTDAVGITVSVLINGIVILDDFNMLCTHPDYNNAKPLYFKAQTPGGVTLQVSVQNGSGNTSTVHVIPCYRQDPKYLESDKTLIKGDCEQVLGLRSLSLRTTAAAALTVTDILDLPEGRGFMRGFWICTDFITTANQALGTHLVTVNGNEILDNVNGLKIGAAFNNTPPYYKAQTPGAVTLQGQFINGSAISANTVIYPQYQQLEKYLIH